jgi:uncharacterized protein (TIGR00369 family)
MTDLPDGAPSPFDEALGVRVVERLEGAVVLRFDPPAFALGGDEPRPYIHGGAIAALVDTAGWAAVYHVSPGEWLAMDLRCDFLRTASLVPHRLLGRCLRAGRRTAVADVEIAAWDDPDRLVAVGRIQFLRVAAS